MNSCNPQQGSLREVTVHRWGFEEWSSLSKISQLVRSRAGSESLRPSSTRAQTHHPAVFWKARLSEKKRHLREGPVTRPIWENAWGEVRVASSSWQKHGTLAVWHGAGGASSHTLSYCRRRERLPSALGPTRFWSHLQVECQAGTLSFLLYVHCLIRLQHTVGAL